MDKKEEADAYMQYHIKKYLMMQMNKPYSGKKEEPSEAAQIPNIQTNLKKKGKII